MPKTGGDKRQNNEKREGEGRMRRGKRRWRRRENGKRKEKINGELGARRRKREKAEEKVPPHSAFSPSFSLLPTSPVKNFLVGHPLTNKLLFKLAST